MRRSSGELKRQAKRNLKGRYGTVILGILAVSAFHGAGSMLTSVLFPGEGTMNLVTGQLFQFILSLVGGILSAGCSYMLLNISRGNPYSLQDLLYFFRHHPDRVIVAGFVLGIINTLASIPYYYVSYTMEMGVTLEEQMAWMTTTTALLMLSTVLTLILTIPFSMTYFCMADDLELTGIQGLKESCRMMRGSLLRYFGLEISFIPLLFLSAFTLYLALLWILPYMEMTFVCFYRDLRGELDEWPDLLQEQQKPCEGQERDDYNSEA
ncbi:MAG: DUF975 family protein [Eubacteriales bacterium]|nr:DUF975 family protein [Eubacteriales bacterium]